MGSHSLFPELGVEFRLMSRLVLLVVLCAQLVACNDQPQVMPDRWADASHEQRMAIAVTEWDAASTAARLLPPEQTAQRRQLCERAEEWLAWLRANDEGMIETLEGHQARACGEFEGRE